MKANETLDNLITAATSSVARIGRASVLLSQLDGLADGGELTPVEMIKLAEAHVLIASGERVAASWLAELTDRANAANSLGALGEMVNMMGGAIVPADSPEGRLIADILKDHEQQESPPDAPQD